MKTDSRQGRAHRRRRAVPVDGVGARRRSKGKWANPQRSVIVNVTRCGDAYCGTVGWANAKNREKGVDPGTRVLSDLKPQGDGVYKGQRLRAQARHQRLGDRPPGRPERDGGQGLRGDGPVLQGTALDADQLSATPSAAISPASTAAWSALISSAQ